ncbi:MAG: hypothetical protein VKK62_11165 [Synechococcaceae cyanobacterium]|nr:hypothetical protein [Synechococcaceae cyanobacterium]
MNSLALQSLRGQIHRFTGVIDRFGGFPQSGRIIQTLCVRDLHLAGTDQPVSPDHWWFRLREDWAQGGIEPGDTVLFTAKVQRCTKGWDQSIATHDRPCRRRDQVIGLGGRIRDVVVTHRAQRHSVVVRELQEQVRRQALLLAEAEAQAGRLEIHRDALLQDIRELQERLHLITTRFRSLDPGATRSLPAKTRLATDGRRRHSFLAREAEHNGGGFASLGR